MTTKEELAKKIVSSGKSVWTAKELVRRFSYQDLDTINKFSKRWK